MITERWLEQADLPSVAESLSKDTFHPTTKPEFFMQPGTVCKVYEMDGKPVMFVRGTKAVRLDIQFVDNNDHAHNSEVMLSEFDKFADQCRQNGFTELVFCTDSPALKAFCKRRFKFKEVKGELRKFL